MKIAGVVSFLEARCSCSHLTNSVETETELVGKRFVLCCNAAWIHMNLELRLHLRHRQPVVTTDSILPFFVTIIPLSDQNFVRFSSLETSAVDLKL